ncbi:MAG: TolB family protein [Planctomycetota bacterium]
MTTSFRISLLFLAGLLGSPVAAQVTRLVSIPSSGGLGDLASSQPAISADGRYIAFQSLATNLVPGDTNDRMDIFVRDLVAGTMEIVSVDSSGAIGNDHSDKPVISADGRYIAFQSYATNLIPSDPYFDRDVYVHDRVTGTTEKVNLTSTGGQTVSGTSSGPSISADGRYVAFQSEASDLVTGDTNGKQDVFVRDLVAGTTARVSLSTAGIQGDEPSLTAKISADGRFVAFSSFATNLVLDDGSINTDVFVHDRLTNETERASVASDGTSALGYSTVGAISADGRFVAFTSEASNLVANDTNGRSDTFLRDRHLETTRRVSLNTGEGQGNGSTFARSISADGRFVVMQSDARNLVPGDVNGVVDVLVRDRLNNTMQRMSLDSAGAQANVGSFNPVISADGRWVAFQTSASNLIPVDYNGQPDVFVRDREAADFSIMCDPGVGGVANCPCSNPPSGRSRGCDNSSATGGAALTASGMTELSADSLVFTTSGEKPTALSIVLQGTVFADTGIVYGQGVRCVSGSLKRLYAKSAVGGSITAPDFGAGDQSVSARSAAKGDVIQPGQPRWYMVYYRDNTVLGGCPSSSTFNTTQTGMVSWAP